jgi:phage/plasmid primase-like uncharacterized protein
MADLVNIFGAPITLGQKQEAAPLEHQIADAMLAAGLTPPHPIHIDGKLHRFRTGTKGQGGHGDKTGWYVFYPDGIAAGKFGCWRAGLESNWRAEIGRTLTPVEEMAHAKRLAEAKSAREAELAKSRTAAANTVEQIWVGAAAASPDHPYLARKGVQPHGARVITDGRLIVPLYGSDGALSSLQYIDHNGGKLYQQGGATGGKYWQIGTTDEPGTIYLAEGFATAATIHEATGRPCVVAYSASNLVPVCGAIREQFGPTQDLVIVADHDASGTGQKYADQASAKYGARVVMPPEPGDANDYAKAGNDLKALLMPVTGQNVIEKLKVIFGDQLGAEYEPPNELIEGLITLQSLAVLYGDSNSGKTFFALSLATAIATGESCYSRRVDPGLVLYLASEAPGSIRSRMQALKKFHKCDLRRLAMVPVPLNFYAGDGDVTDVYEVVKAIEQEKGEPVRLIIGDTLARMSAGANENSGEDMGPVMARFDRLSQATGAAVLIIHHSGKDQARGARGWSGIRAHIDTEIEVVEKDGERTASITKQRELPSKGDGIAFKLEVVEMGTTKFGAPATTCVAIPDEEPRQTRQKADNKVEANRKLFERAWFDAGCELRDEKPYLSRSGLKTKLRKDDVKDTMVDKMLRPGKPQELIGSLLTANIIEPYEHGWIVIAEAHASAMRLKIVKV